MKHIFAVIVTYHPGDISALLHSFRAQCTEIVVVDNSEGDSSTLASLCTDIGATLIALGRNVGIAGAQNIGIDYALDHGADAVILSDQDSIPGPTMVATLAAFLGPGIGAVGPVPFDGEEPLVYTDHRWGPKRPSTLPDDKPIEAAFLLASGCLIPADVIRHVGLMPADYFIDHVDLAWSMHARSLGYRLLAIPHVRLTHSLGDGRIKVAGRKRTVHTHSPIRNYYLTRNTFELMRNHDLPFLWRIRYGYWISRFAVFTILTNDHRRQRARMITAGIRDGLRRRMGKIPN
ncbi:glycosyltransferase family 2 protein [Arcanobacterium buesumense]|uniref:Glycosyltransferase family 2 protein n=1 Tax=Arcanobacterium buesumense TaxID=2722751 RepID=A0A6H2EJ18_9ACTO|nr:glycosyltransferase family 2 protein [Arcanobacterium buesumense]QJC21134.1 glycosyltransferase family 2 protein [Arcanobacterium buesumense]